MIDPTQLADAMLFGLAALIPVAIICVYWIGRGVDTLEDDDG